MISSFFKFIDHCINICIAKILFAIMHETPKIQDLNVIYKTINESRYYMSEINRNNIDYDLMNKLRSKFWNEQVGQIQTLFSGRL